MFERQPDVVDRIIAHLRRPMGIDPALDARVMQEIARLPAGRSAGVLATGWGWLIRPRQLAVSPLVALAAGLVLALALPARRWLTAPAASTSREFQFVLLAPRAATVTLVGDFNDWDASRTPMHRAQGGALWSATVSLTPGRYRYAFLVNTSQWVADPAAPAAPDDEFGAPSSVVTVAGS